jgi:carbon monoxide dehydrogenase subunit G
MTEFVSRTGNLTCTPVEIFDFVTDIRNFEQFVPEGSIDNMHIERDSCSFRIPQMGNVDMYLSEKEPCSKVVYKGTALKSQDFSLLLNITGNKSGKAEVDVKLTAELNPIMKMVAEEPIKRFLETLIHEMEKFSGWKRTII